MIRSCRCLALVLTPLALLLLRILPSHAQSACPGDCNGGNTVTVNELIAMVNIALGNTGISTCTAGDGNHDSAISINELVAAVGAALIGCPPSGFIPMEFNNETITDASLPAPVTLNGTLNVSADGIVTGLLDAAFGNNGRATIVATSDGSAFVQIGNSQLGVRSLSQSVDSIAAALRRDIDSGSSPDKWAASEQSILALMALASTPSWISNVTAADARSQKLREFTPVNLLEANLRQTDSSDGGIFCDIASLVFAVRVTLAAEPGCAALAGACLLAAEAPPLIAACEVFVETVCGVGIFLGGDAAYQFALAHWGASSTPTPTETQKIPTPTDTGTTATPKGTPSVTATDRPTATLTPTPTPTAAPTVTETCGTPADCQVEAVFGIPPWNVLDEVPPEFVNFGTYTCISTGDPFADAAGCLVTGFNLDGRVMFRSDLGLDSTGSVPPSGYPFGTDGTLSRSIRPRCSAPFTLPNGRAAVMCRLLFYAGTSSRPLIPCDGTGGGCTVSIPCGYPFFCSAYAGPEDCAISGCELGDCPAGQTCNGVLCSSCTPPRYQCGCS